MIFRDGEILKEIGKDLGKRDWIGWIVGRCFLFTDNVEVGFRLGLGRKIFKGRNWGAIDEENIRIFLFKWFC